MFVCMYILLHIYNTKPIKKIINVNVPEYKYIYLSFARFALNKIKNLQRIF